jgi:thiamine pyrophosphokinase
MRNHASMVDMAPALLVCGGAAPPRHAVQHLFARASYICAADSGLDTLEAWQLVPQLIVGDMDSLSNRGLLSRYRESGSIILEQNSYKDDTDTETALRELKKRGHQTIIVLGGGGGRIDHLLAIHALFLRPDGPHEWYTDKERLVKLEKPREFRIGCGQVVSAFPLAQCASGMKSQGLEWPLDGLVWEPGYFGISNQSTNETIMVDPGRNGLLLILPLQTA